MTASSGGGPLAPAGSSVTDLLTDQKIQFGISSGIVSSNKNLSFVFGMFRVK